MSGPHLHQGPTVSLNSIKLHQISQTHRYQFPKHENITSLAEVNLVNNVICSIQTGDMFEFKSTWSVWVRCWATMSRRSSFMVPLHCLSKPLGLCRSDGKPFFQNILTNLVFCCRWLRLLSNVSIHNLPQVFDWVEVLVEKARSVWFSYSNR